jgi:NADPH-dependent 2,4-dienoyl-CoA reductase/sulfur reductase-like enzyme
MHLVVVGVVVGDAFPNFSICGLPYLLSGEVKDWRDLAHRSRANLEGAGLRLILETSVRAIDPVARTLAMVDRSSHEAGMRWDALVIATGADPVRPPIAGLDSPSSTSTCPTLRRLGVPGTPSSPQLRHGNTPDRGPAGRRSLGEKPPIWRLVTQRRAGELLGRSWKRRVVARCHWGIGSR